MALNNEEIARLLEPDLTPKVSDEFGYWFAGLVDGEGNFVVDIRWQSSTPDAPVRKVALRIQIRADDESMLLHIQNNIGGHLGEEGRFRRWTMQRVAHCAKILIPIFDKYPLYSKKRLEYPLWRECVIKHYELNQLRARNPKGTEEVNALFTSTKKHLSETRMYLGR